MTSTSTGTFLVILSKTEPKTVSLKKSVAKISCQPTKTETLVSAHRRTTVYFKLNCEEAFSSCHKIMTIKINFWGCCCHVHVSLSTWGDSKCECFQSRSTESITGGEERCNGRRECIKGKTTTERSQHVSWQRVATSALRGKHANVLLSQLCRRGTALSAEALHPEM